MLNLNVEIWEPVPANTYKLRISQNMCSQNGGQEGKIPKFCEDYLNVCVFYFTRLHPDDGRTYSWKMLVGKQDFVFGSDQESPSWFKPFNSQ